MQILNVIVTNEDGAIEIINSFINNKNGAEECFIERIQAVYDMRGWGEISTDDKIEFLADTEYYDEEDGFTIRLYCSDNVC